ncbi:MAG: Rv3654c family TadE-like protein [Propionicimonas sp.]
MSGVRSGRGISDAVDSSAGDCAGGGSPSGGERGSGTVIAAAGVLVAAMVAAAVIVGAGAILAVHRVRAAADLVAVSAAGEKSRGGDACRIARQLASANGVSVRECRISGDDLDFVVSVRVALLMGPQLRGPRIEATAHAGRLSATGG